MYKEKVIKQFLSQKNKYVQKNSFKTTSLRIISMIKLLRLNTWQRKGNGCHYN